MDLGAMGHIRDKMEADLQLRGFSRATQDSYLRCARRFVAHYMRSPTQLGEQEIRDFLLHLVNHQKVRPATHRMYVASLKFLYVTTLERPEQVARIPWPKVPKTLPEVLSGQEVSRLLEAVESIRHRAIVMTTYAAGLGIQEVCSLRVSDIDSQRMLLHIRHAKRGKDRYVMLSQPLLVVLRQYYKLIRP